MPDTMLGYHWDLNGKPDSPSRSLQCLGWGAGVGTPRFSIVGPQKESNWPKPMGQERLSGGSGVCAEPRVLRLYSFQFCDKSSWLLTTFRCINTAPCR